MPKYLNNFNYNGKNCAVNYLETTTVNEFATCDVYAFIKDTYKDLAIITIQPGGSTPLQLVLDGKQTIEGYISGSGSLLITRGNGMVEKYVLNPMTND